MAKKQDINEKMRSLTREQARAIGRGLNAPVTKEAREKEERLGRERDAMLAGTALSSAPARKKSSAKK